MLFQGINFPATLPLNQSFYHPKTSTHSESGLTCNIPATRKRSRDEFYCGAQKSNQFFKLPQILDFRTYEENPIGIAGAAEARG
ncbi:hypothetical protein AAHA92_05103 [Salvia divinorum]|uniref:Uncharacterized protein n=1 Tax=Salvia divinorum TaxID=28513 RepID=A0ABD1I3Z6_SALDI